MNKDSINRIKPENFFLLVSVLFFFLWQFIFPPFEAPDETDHYLRAYMISEGHFIAENNEAGELGAYFPESVIDMIRKTDRERIFEHPNEKQYLSALMDASKIYLSEPRNDMFCSTAAMGLYSPIVYLPQVIGITCGRICNMPILYGYYLARLANIIIYLLFAYFSIKIIPFLKFSLLTICLLPITIQEVSSVAADGPVIGICILAISYIFYLAYSPEVNYIKPKNIIYIGLLFIAISLAKSAYIPLCFLYFLIPAQKFYSSCWRWKYGVILIFSSIITWSAWSLSFLMIEIPPFATRYGANIIPSEQMSYIYQNPSFFVIRCFYTIPLDVLRAFVLGCSDIIKPIFFILPYSLLMFMPVFDQNDMNKINLVEKKRMQSLFIFFIFIILFIIIHLSIFITWPQPIDDIINGVHGRYFIPFIILLIVVFSQNLIYTRFIKDINEFSYVYYISIPIMLFFCSFWIWQRYYG